MIRVKLNVQPWFKWTSLLLTATLTLAWIFQAGVMVGASAVWVLIPLGPLAVLRIYYSVRERRRERDPDVQRELRLLEMYRALGGDTRRK